MFTYDSYEDICVVTGITASATKVIMPEFIDGLQVRRISEGAFKNNNTLEEIYLPDCLADISEEAFRNCANLRLVHFYKSSKSRDFIYLCTAAFQDCRSLEQIKVDSALGFNIAYNTRIFAGCINLQTIEGFFYSDIPGHTFYNCHKLDNITFKQSSFLYKIAFASTSLIGSTSLKNMTIVGALDPCQPSNILKKLNSITIKQLPVTNYI